ncbi:MAG: Gfo/Idh/MocA family protein [Bacillota bacterium]
MSNPISRRRFLGHSAAVAAAVSAGPAILRSASPSEKLNIACIGVGGRGGAHLGPAGTENVVAICDVDLNTLEKVSQQFPSARKYQDYRVLFDKQKDIDAVIVATPDHHHFSAAMRAIQQGKHVYCEKPLTHTIWEARMLTEAARKHKVATQMGNQGHSGEGYRVLCENIWAGSIGEVREVHCWTNRPIWPQGLDRPAGQDPVPASLDWDLWLGPAPIRPFKAKWPEASKSKRDVYHPFTWRGFWDFGTGALGDMGCHIMDGACWALKLTNPTKVELIDSAPIKKDMAPSWSILRYHFPARAGLPPCTLTWYDGGKLPKRPEDLEPDRKLAEGNNGSLFIGSKGKMMSGTYGDGTMIFPEEKRKATPRPEKTIPRVEGKRVDGKVVVDGHHYDWIQACKGGKPSSANFDYAGPFTEIVLLGNLALRVGQTIEWDAANMRVTNVPEANQYVKTEYRKGWEF